MVDMKKEVFKEGTFLYNITYKVKKGQVPFVNVLLWGLVGKLVTGILAFSLPNLITVVIDLGYTVAWFYQMWYSRNNVYHPMWFYAGYGLSIFITLVMALKSF